MICKFVEILPRGKELKMMLWGSPIVRDVTLNRFFSFHYILRFVLLGFVVLHIIMLHKRGSTNPIGGRSHPIMVPFVPYYVTFDVVIFAVVMLLFFITFNFTGLRVYFFNRDNYIPANPLKTPSHIVPEWYFLALYAVLRRVRRKTGGILLMAVVALTPVFFLVIKNSRHRGLTACCFMGLFIVLTWLGAQEPIYPYNYYRAVAVVL